MNLSSSKHNLIILNICKNFVLAGKAPFKISIDSGFSTYCWMARFNGRAP